VRALTFQFLAPNLLNPCPRFFSIAFIGNSNLLMLAHSRTPSARHCTKLYSSKRSSSSLSLCDKASNCAAAASQVSEQRRDIRTCELWCRQTFTSMNKHSVSEKTGGECDAIYIAVHRWRSNSGALGGLHGQTVNRPLSSHNLLMGADGRAVGL
jgi:hypothetical protein